MLTSSRPEVVTWLFFPRQGACHYRLTLETQTKDVTLTVYSSNFAQLSLNTYDTLLWQSLPPIHWSRLDADWITTKVILRYFLCRADLDCTLYIIRRQSDLGKNAGSAQKPSSFQRLHFRRLHEPLKESGPWTETQLPIPGSCYAVVRVATLPLCPKVTISKMSLRCKTLPELIFAHSSRTELLILAFFSDNIVFAVHQWL